MDTEPLAYRITDVRRTLGLGNTTVYKLISDGVLDARKAGGRTLVTGESIRAYVSSLPKATISVGQRKAAA